MSAFKCILTVLWLALFTEQSSYKFYQFSSAQQSHSRSAASNEAYTGGNHIISNFPTHTGVSLSLDKRYNLKHIFTLSDPLLSTDPLPVEHKNKYYVSQSEATVYSLCFTAAVRGPPVS